MRKPVPRNQGFGRISDWIHIENRKLVGGETLRALRAAERADFDKSIPFTID